MDRTKMEQALSGVELRFQEPMKLYTTFKVGGPADAIALPKNEEEVIRVMAYAKENNIPLTIIGNGSNLLVRDKGIRGLVMKIGENMAQITQEGNRITFGAGLILAKAASYAQKQGLSGMEFAHGIPGSVGGAVFMDAGAYGGEMKDIIVSTCYIDEEGKLRTVEGSAHDFGYRHSMFIDRNCVVISTTVELKPDDPQAILERMQEFARRRKEKQPLEMPSAGSTFKRPEGYFAGKLIQDCGLKGYRVGGAMVSEKHSGFVVNAGDATCEDILALIRHVQKTVKAQFGVDMECEVRLIGEE